jgi:putative phosphoribosyl transferase
LDLLTEDEAQDRAKVFDIALLSRRMVEVVDWLATRDEIAGQPIGLFGASTGAAAALCAAADRPVLVVAVVSRGGRADLALHTWRACWHRLC